MSRLDETGRQFKELQAEFPVRRPSSSNGFGLAMLYVIGMREYGR